MHRSRLTILNGAVIGLLTLPLVRFPVTGNVNSIDGDGWPAVALIGMVAVLALLGDRAEGLAMAPALVAAATSGAAMVFSVLKLTDASNAADTIPDASIGVGAWVLVAAAMITLTGVALTLSRKLS